jgi:hypothetical protein
VSAWMGRMMNDRWSTSKFKPFIPDVISPVLILMWYTLCQANVSGRPSVGLKRGQSRRMLEMIYDIVR